MDENERHEVCLADKVESLSRYDFCNVFAMLRQLTKTKVSQEAVVHVRVIAAGSPISFRSQDFSTA